MSGWSLADVEAMEASGALDQQIVAYGRDEQAARQRGARRQAFESETNYAAVGGGAVQAYRDPSYRNEDLAGPLSAFGVPAAQFAAIPTYSRPVAAASQGSALPSSFVSQEAAAPGGMILRWLRLLFLNLLQLLRPGYTRAAEASEPGDADPTVVGAMEEAVRPITEQGLLHAARIFAEGGQALCTLTPTSPVAVPRRRR